MVQILLPLPSCVTLASPAPLWASVRARRSIQGSPSTCCPPGRSERQPLQGVAGQHDGDKGRASLGGSVCFFFPEQWPERWWGRGSE